MGVDRYDCEYSMDHDDIVFDKSKTGTWCMYKDVKKLERKIQQLTEIINDINSEVKEAVESVLKLYEEGE